MFQFWKGTTFVRRVMASEYSITWRNDTPPEEQMFLLDADISHYHIQLKFQMFYKCFMNVFVLLEWRSNEITNRLPITNPGIAGFKTYRWLFQSKEYHKLLGTYWEIVNCLLEMAVQGWGIWIQSIESCQSFLTKRVAMVCCRKISWISIFCPLFPTPVFFEVERCFSEKASWKEFS